MNIMNICKLEKSDRIEYIELISSFRPLDIDISEEVFNKIYDEIFKTDKIFVCKIDNVIIGTVKLLIEQKFIHNLSKYGRIEDVIVKNEYRNKGIGTKLINFIINYCKKYKFFKISLTCSSDLIKFYEKNNFEVYQINMSQLINN